MTGWPVPVERSHMSKRKSRRKTYPIEFEWHPEKDDLAISRRCWNKFFWYGDGTVATEASVIIRRSDYNALLRELRELRQGRR